MDWLETFVYNSLGISLITHKLSLIKNCDNIIVMQNGTVIQTGTPAELMNSDGYFMHSMLL